MRVFYHTQPPWQPNSARFPGGHAGLLEFLIVRGFGCLDGGGGGLSFNGQGYLNDRRFRFWGGLYG